jgi:hypothetical protein
MALIIIDEFTEVSVKQATGEIGWTPIQSTLGNLVPSGTVIAAGTFVHQQNTAASNWTIVHNFGTVPNVTVVDSSGHLVDGDITYPDLNTCVVSFSAALGGTAYLI